MRYVVSIKSGLYTFFQTSGGLFWSQYLGDGLWSNATSIFNGKIEYFKVSLCKGRVLIVYQTSQAAICVVFNDGEVTETTLVEGGLEGRYHALPINDTDIFLVHNMPISREYSHILMSHIINGDGTWSQSKNIGRVVPFGHGYAFDMLPVRDNHFLLFYQAQGAGFGADLGFREILGNKISEFNIVERNANINGLCHSFLATPSGVHMAYMTKGLLAPTLYYIKKDEHGLSQKTTIAQGSNVHSPLIYLKNGELKLLYMRGNNVFSTALSKSSLAFTQHKEKIGAHQKCRFLHENNINSQYYANEILMDTTNQRQLKLFDDLVSFEKLVKPYKTKSHNTSIKQAPKVGSQKDYNNFFDDFGTLI